MRVPALKLVRSMALRAAAAGCRACVLRSDLEKRSKAPARRPSCRAAAPVAVSEKRISPALTFRRGEAGRASRRCGIGSATRSRATSTTTSPSRRAQHTALGLDPFGATEQRDRGPGERSRGRKHAQHAGPTRARRAPIVRYLDRAHLPLPTADSMVALPARPLVGLRIPAAPRDADASPATCAAAARSGGRRALLVGSTAPIGHTGRPTLGACGERSLEPRR